MEGQLNYGFSIYGKEMEGDIVQTTLSINVIVKEESELHGVKGEFIY